MATTLATARGSVYTTLAAALTNCNGYKRRQTDYKFPCFLVSWPTSYDVAPDQGDERDFDLIVSFAVEVGDDDSADDLLSSILDTGAAALLAGNGAWGVGPANNFGEQLTEDNRTI